jgi:hypothetical protein
MKQAAAAATRGNSEPQRTRAQPPDILTRRTDLTTADASYLFDESFARNAHFD